MILVILLVVGALVLCSSLAWVVAYLVGLVRGRREAPGGQPLAAITTEAEAGPIWVTGTVVSPAPLAAPYTGRPCCYYRLEYLYDASGQIVHRETSDHQDFELHDQGVRAQVLVHRAGYEVIADILETGRASQITAKGRALLEKLGWPIPEIGRIELCEAIVAVDAPIDVEGAATREPDLRVVPGERGYRDGASTMLVFSGELVVRGENRERRYIGTT
jgi:hypothetical protein